jgi:hypothetical protein
VSDTLLLTIKHKGETLQDLLNATVDTDFVRVMCNSKTDISVTEAVVSNIKHLHKQILAILVLFKESLKDHNPHEVREAKINRIERLTMQV